MNRRALQTKERTRPEAQDGKELDNVQARREDQCEWMRERKSLACTGQGQRCPGLSVHEKDYRVCFQSAVTNPQLNVITKSK